MKCRSPTGTIPGTPGTAALAQLTLIEPHQARFSTPVFMETVFALMEPQQAHLSLTPIVISTGPLVEAEAPRAVITWAVFEGIAA